MSIVGEFPRDDEEDDEEDRVDTKKSKESDKSWTDFCKNVRFLVKSGVQIAHFCLSITALVLFAHVGEHGLFVTQLIVVMIDSTLSTLITFSDLDVQRWVRSAEDGPPSFLKAIIIGLLCGLLQLIHVKRAWARQIKVAGILSQLQGDELGEEFLWTGPALGGEGAYPVNFLTGMFSALISNYAYLFVRGSSVKGAQGDVISNLILAYGASSVIIVALCVVELDLAVSNYVMTRYHFDTSKKGTRVGHLQLFFPIAHVAYRTAEVMMRALLISMTVVFLTLTLARFWVAVALTFAFFMCDYALGVWTLWMFSPEDEALKAHVLVGVALPLSNMTRLIDVPGFCRPAQLVSRNLDVRIMWLMSWVVVFWVWPDPTQEDCQVDETCVQHRWGTSEWQLLVSAIVHYALRLAFFRSNGDDLHSCVVLGKHRRLEKLLSRGMNGEALDVNSYMKDRKKRTPAMLAAKRGDVASLELLFDAGARVQPADMAGYTCVHYAVQTAKLKAFEFLLEQDGASEVLRKDGDELQKLILECAGSSLLNSRNMIADFTTVLAKARRDINSGERRLSPARKQALASIRPTSVGDQMLNNFFPGAVKEEMPKMQELRSVSALVIAHSLGPLAKIFFFEKKRPHSLGPHRGMTLHDNDASEGSLKNPSQASSWVSRSSHVALERLTKTKVLGQGGAASVIEVEERLGQELSPSGSSSFVQALSSHTPFTWMPSFSMSQTHSQSALRGEGGLAAGRQISLLPSGTGNLSATHAASASGAGSTMSAALTPRRFAMKLQKKTSAAAGFNVASEALALQRIQHPFIVRLEHAFQTPQFYALVLELCPGGDLNKLLVAEVGPDGFCPGLPVARVARYCGQALLALAHLHKVHRLVYRDMKPANVLISAADEAKLADFGLVSHISQGSKAKKMSTAGTPGFRAPELFFGNDEGEDEIDPFLLDPFSFGITLEIALLGEDASDKVGQEAVERKSPTNASDKGTVSLVPRGSIDEQLEGMKEACDRGRISPEAVELITGLIQVNTTSRWRILDPRVLDHVFFVKTLGLDSLEDLMTTHRGQFQHQLTLARQDSMSTS